MRTTHSIEAVLGDFNPKEQGQVPLKSGAPVTIWLPAEWKARYDSLQKMSGRRFSKKARETLCALIEIAEERAS